MKFKWLFAVITLNLILSACGNNVHGPVIEVQDPWARAVSMPDSEHSGEQGGEGVQRMGINGAVYMVLKNGGSQMDKLLRADSKVSEAVELHISEMKDGVMSMHQVPYIEVLPKSQKELQPGGLHVMLIGLQQDLEVGDTISLTLVFEKSGAMVIEAEVREP